MNKQTLVTIKNQTIQKIKEKKDKEHIKTLQTFSAAAFGNAIQLGRAYDFAGATK
jgi:hypothetical protein